ncbi:MAG: molybdate ABC transporter permease subunit [Planctomycetes bacterium]|nr:molybdate ABC transporter permease subunit [Planctomycetota bacterium]
MVLATTLRIAGTATLLVALPAIALGFALARASFFGKSVVETLVAVPLVLPPTAIGYLLLRAFAHDGPFGPSVLGFDLDVLFTWRGAMLASAVVAFPLVTRAARGAFEGVEPRLELVARTHGLSRGATWFSVTLPLARRGLLAALALGFGRALGEFGATVIVAGNIRGHTQTLALAIFEDIQLGSDEHALLLVGVTLAIAFVLMWSVEWLSRPRRTRSA